MGPTTTIILTLGGAGGGGLGGAGLGGAGLKARKQRIRTGGARSNRRKPNITKCGPVAMEPGRPREEETGEQGSKGHLLHIQVARGWCQVIYS